MEKKISDEEIEYWEAYETGQIPRGLGLGWSHEKVIAVMLQRQKRAKEALNGK